MRKRQTDPISVAIKKLRKNLAEIARVSEWAESLGYEDPKTFGEDFLQYHDIRPHKVMDCIRLKSIIIHLRADKHTNHKIARAHSLTNEKALNNYTNYHLDYSPKELKSMQEDELQLLLEKIDSKIQK